MTTNDLFDFIKKRRSIGRLDIPAPNRDEIYQAIDLVMSAPDHHQLKPWRFVVLDNANARSQFGDALLQAETDNAHAQNRTLDDSTINKMHAMPHRAPVIIACISDYKTHSKVPKFEQLLAIGAGVQNLLLAFLAMGYQSIWRTGLLLDSMAVRSFFDVTGDNQICGFIYVGSSDVQMPAREDVNLAHFVQFID